MDEPSLTFVCGSCAAVGVDAALGEGQCRVVCVRTVGVGAAIGDGRCLVAWMRTRELDVGVF